MRLKFLSSNERNMKTLWRIQLQNGSSGETLHFIISHQHCTFSFFICYIHFSLYLLFMKGFMSTEFFLNKTRNAFLRYCGKKTNALSKVNRQPQIFIQNKTPEQSMQTYVQSDFMNKVFDRISIVKKLLALEICKCTRLFLRNTQYIFLNKSHFS